MRTIRFCDSVGDRVSGGRLSQRIGYTHPIPPHREHGTTDTYSSRKDMGPGTRKGPGTRDTLHAQPPLWTDKRL